jgi:hypothetical protein
MLQRFGYSSANAVVSLNISTDTFLIFFPKKELITAITGTVAKK